MHNSVLVDWDFLLLHKKRVILGMSAGFLVATLAFFLVTPQWEASALIQVGQVGATFQQGQPTFVEPIELVTVRMLRPTFIKAATQRSGYPERASDLMPFQYGGRGYLDIRAVNTNAGIVALFTKAPSSELAKQLAEGFAAELAEEHRQIIEPQQLYANEIFSKLQGEMNRLGKAPLFKKLPNSPKAEGEDSQDNTRHPMSRQIIDDLIVQDRYQALLIAGALKEPYTRPTHVVGEVEVSTQPVFPRPLHFAALGGLLGLGMTAGLLSRAKAK